jgi:hypothetical protein
MFHMSAKTTAILRLQWRSWYALKAVPLAKAHDLACLYCGLSRTKIERISDGVRAWSGQVRALSGIDPCPSKYIRCCAAGVKVTRHPQLGNCIATDGSIWKRNDFQALMIPRIQPRKLT